MQLFIGMKHIAFAPRQVMGVFSCLHVAQHHMGATLHWQKATPDPDKADQWVAQVSDTCVLSITETTLITE